MLDGITAVFAELGVQRLGYLNSNVLDRWDYASR